MKHIGLTNRMLLLITAFLMHGALTINHSLISSFKDAAFSKLVSDARKFCNRCLNIVDYRISEPHLAELTRILTKSINHLITTL